MPRRQPAAWLVAIGLSLTLGLAGCTPGAENVAEPSPASTTPEPTSVPAATSVPFASGLERATAMAIAPDGMILVTAGTELIRVDQAGEQTIASHDLTDIAPTGPGLVDVVLDPSFPGTPVIYVCYRTSADLRVVPLTIDRTMTSAVAGLPLLTGLPLPVTGERGCRLAFGPDRYLYVGTADGGDPTAPQDQSKLGGKILRIDVHTRQHPASNPFADRPEAASKLVYSYGHREITGLAWHPTTGTLYAIDQGPGRQDEVNVIEPGGNYGWNPASASATAYQTEKVPMTDLTIASARPAAWNSGNTAPGLGQALFVRGNQWGVLTSDLAITNLAGPRVLFLQVTGQVVADPLTLATVNPIGATGALGQDADGNLYLLTAAGGPERLVRVSTTN